ncbi:MAG: IS110 family transposase [Nitrospinota bacterium]
MHRQLTKNLQKRKRITRHTLVVGVDIGSRSNAVALMQHDGAILKTAARVKTSRKGFTFFRTLLLDTLRSHGLKEVLIGLEPTGHYWRKLAFFALAQGWEVRFVRTTALKHQRELDESAPGKSDRRDACTIANLVREGKYLDSVIEEGVFRQLRALAKTRERLQKAATAAQNVLGALMDDYFPELRGVFSSLKVKGLWAVLEHCPFPADVRATAPAELEACIAQASKGCCDAQAKAVAIRAAAQESIGLPAVSRADRLRVQIALEELRRLVAHQKAVETEMKRLLRPLPEAKWLRSIPGMGLISVAVFLGELGNPRHFAQWREVVKFIGLDPVERASGLFVGRKRISKKGRYLLRKFLYFMTLRVIQYSTYFKAVYARRLATPNRRGQALTKKEAICAVSLKLIKVMMALLKQQRVFHDTVPARLAQAA